jgi:hypothetical protein
MLSRAERQDLVEQVSLHFSSNKKLLSQSLLRALFKSGDAGLTEAEIKPYPRGLRTFYKVCAHSPVASLMVSRMAQLRQAAISSVPELIDYLRTDLQDYFTNDRVGRSSLHRISVTDARTDPGVVYKITFLPNTFQHDRLMDLNQRGIKVFLCHSSDDKDRIRELYRLLTRDGFAAWLDEQDLLPGQDWDLEIRKAVRSSHVVLVCLSNRSVTKEGFVQKEVRVVLDVADEKPDGVIYLVPARLDECPVPDRLRKWHRVDLFDPNGYDHLVQALRSNAISKGA